MEQKDYNEYLVVEYLTDDINDKNLNVEECIRSYKSCWTLEEANNYLRYSLLDSLLLERDGAEFPYIKVGIVGYIDGETDMDRLDEYTVNLQEYCERQSGAIKS